MSFFSDPGFSRLMTPLEFGLAAVVAVKPSISVLADLPAWVAPAAVGILVANGTNGVFRVLKPKAPKPGGHIHG